MSPLQPPIAVGSVDLPRLAGDDSQRVFDALLRTLAEPGTLRRLPRSLCDAVPPVLLGPLSLADVDVTVCVEGGHGPALAAALSRATGAPVAAPTEAAIVTLTAGAVGADETLASARTGDALAPELAARVFVAVDHLLTEPDADGTTEVDGTAEAHDVGVVADTEAVDSPGAQAGGVRLILRGPGVPGVRTIDVAGLDAAAAARLGRSSAPFPAGIDVWLVASDGAVVGIPRSTSVEVGPVHRAAHPSPQPGPTGDRSPDAGAAGAGETPGS